MSRSGFALLLLAVSPVYAERPIDGWVPTDEPVRSSTAAAHAAGLSRTTELFLNRCASGCPVPSALDSSTTAGPSAEPARCARSRTATTPGKVVECVKDVFSPFNVMSSMSNPGTANHFEIMIARLAADSAFPTNVGGVAPPAACQRYIAERARVRLRGWGSGHGRAAPLRRGHLRDRRAGDRAHVVQHGSRDRSQTIR